MKIIATDLDRTLMPNGNHRLSKGAMEYFKKALKKNGVKLIYVTGRYKRMIKDGMKRYKTPKPDFCISLLGTVIYDFCKKDFVEDKEWQKKLEKDWKHYKRKDVAKILEDVKEIWEQPKPVLNDYKESYYYKLGVDADKLDKKIYTKLKKKGIKAVIITSTDVNRKIGMLDVVPYTGTKMAALNYLMKKLKVKKKNVLYCGDSGNDLLPMTSGVKGVLVKNASDRTKERLKKIVQRKKLGSKVTIAEGGFKGFNGNYVAGIIEAAHKFGFFK